MSAPVGKFYTDASLAQELAEQVVRMAPVRGVLDPTCGDGRLLDAVRELLPDVPLYGMDRDPASVEACRAKGHDARVGDSLFDEVPDADVWTLNPPYLGGLKIRSVLGEEYRQRIKAQWPDAHGNADYCVYWLLRGNDLPGVRGMVGVFTNTIAQGDTRRSGLRYLLQDSETGWIISWAWRRRKWKGDKAAVVVSLVALERLLQWTDEEEPVPPPFIPPSGKGRTAPPWRQLPGNDWKRPGAAEVRQVVGRSGWLVDVRAPAPADRFVDSPEEGRALADVWLAAGDWVVPDPAPPLSVLVGAAQLGLFGRAA